MMKIQRKWTFFNHVS